jgi:quercetin dioxygenase-like cupin family protein
MVGPTIDGRRGIGQQWVAGPAAPLVEEVARTHGSPSAVPIHDKVTMQKMSLDALAREHLERARQHSAGRSSETVYGGHEHSLRQTVVALTAGTTLADHENPGEATLHVLTGRVRLGAGTDVWEGRDGDLIVIPPGRHNLEAVTDAVVLLTVAMRL